MWHQLAQDSRKGATLLFRHEHYRSAISRAYYATYSAVVAVLSKVPALRWPTGRHGPAHAVLPKLVQVHWPIANQAKRDLIARLLGELYLMRVRADYHPKDIVDKAEARLAVGLMSKTLNLVY